MKKAARPVLKEKQPQATAAQKPTWEREDWDFECRPSQGGKPKYPGCPDNELRDCYEYEYSRELALRHQGHDPKADKHDKRLSRFYELFADEFPHVPWLQIDSTVRKKRLLELEAGWPAMPPFSPVTLDGLTRDGELRNELEWVQVASENHMVTVLPVQIAWQHSNDAIIEAFSTWLEENRPMQFFPKVNPQGSGEKKVIRGAIKALGAYRLLRNRSRREASVYSSEQRGGKNDSLYSYNADGPWSEAKKLTTQIVAAWDRPGKLVSDFLHFLPPVRDTSEEHFLATVKLSGLRRWLALGTDKTTGKILERALMHEAHGAGNRAYFGRAVAPRETLGSVKPVPFSLTQGPSEWTPELVAASKANAPIEYMVQFEGLSAKERAAARRRIAAHRKKRGGHVAPKDDSTADT